MYGGQYRNLKNSPGYMVVAVGTCTIAAVEAEANYSRLGRDLMTTTRAQSDYDMQAQASEPARQAAS